MRLQKRDPQTAKLQERLDPVVTGMGFELVDLAFTQERGQPILQIFVDTVPPGDAKRGITVDDCSVISRTLGDLLDVEDLVPGAYRLEVSSPGLFRPLTKAEHFERVVGERVKLRTYAPKDGRRGYTGQLVAVTETGLTVNVDGVDYALSYEELSKANLEPDLGF